MVLSGTNATDGKECIIMGNCSFEIICKNLIQKNIYFISFFEKKRAVFV